MVLDALDGNLRLVLDLERECFASATADLTEDNRRSLWDEIAGKLGTQWGGVDGHGAMSEALGPASKTDSMLLRDLLLSECWPGTKPSLGRWSWLSEPLTNGLQQEPVKLCLPTWMLLADEGMESAGPYRLNRRVVCQLIPDDSAREQFVRALLDASEAPGAGGADPALEAMREQADRWLQQGASCTDIIGNSQGSA